MFRRCRRSCSRPSPLASRTTRPRRVVRARVWLLAGGGFVALLFAYAGGRIGTHQWCIGDVEGPAYCEHTNGHHALYLVEGLASVISLLKGGYDNIAGEVGILS